MTTKFSLAAISIIILFNSCIATKQTTSFKFKAPWSNHGMQQTDCKLWADNDSLYFHFDTVDSSLVSLSQDNFHNGIGLSDRVEIFFTTDTLLSKYYGMELCYDGRVLDFTGESYRKIDYEWSWPTSALSTTCTESELGYHCQGAFALSYLATIGLIQNDQLNIGVFRADYHDMQDPLDVTWITVKDPYVPNPDFHIYSAFFQYSLK